MTTLSADSVTWAIEHLKQVGDTNIFPKPFEFDAIAASRDDVVKALMKEDICQWSTRPYRKCLVPKHRYEG